MFLCLLGPKERKYSKRPLTVSHGASTALVPRLSISTKWPLNRSREVGSKTDSLVAFPTQSFRKITKLSEIRHCYFFVCLFPSRHIQKLSSDAIFTLKDQTEASNWTRHERRFNAFASTVYLTSKQVKKHILVRKMSKGITIQNETWSSCW